MRKTPITPNAAIATSFAPTLPAPSSVRTVHHGRRLVLQLLSLGLILELLYLMLYPFLLNHAAPSDPLALAWKTQFFWLKPLQPAAQMLEELLARVPWLNPAQIAGNARSFLLLSVLALLLVIWAALLGRGRRRSPLTPGSMRALFWTILLLTVLFALTLLGSPLAFDAGSQDVLLSWLSGRMVVIHHVNPYLVSPARFPQDVAQQLLVTAPQVPTHALANPLSAFGPLWIDISILVSLVVHDSVVSAFLGFRFVGLCIHIVSSILIWSILSKTKPQLRLSVTLLYAWNPLVLLLSVSQIHPELVVLLLVLLALLFLLRDALVLSWFFVLLASLANFTALLLLPLFFRIILHKSRFMHKILQFFLLVWLLVLSSGVMVLAYIPYWQDWGLPGLLSSLQQVFWSNVAINSLNAAILQLPHQPLPAILWLLSPHHWMALTFILLAFFLLFALWIVDATELLILCCGWVLLLFVVLQPVYWPWYMLLPFALALASANIRTILLALLLVCGALLSFVFWWWYPAWPGQGLVSIGLPFLLWGWTMFFTSGWLITGASDSGNLLDDTESRPRLARPPWLSRPWPSRPGTGRRHSL